MSTYKFTESTENPYYFTARRYDPETGNYYYRARYYSPATGRFLQTDPIGYKGGLNLYTYCGNNPIILVDPYGLCGNKGGYDYGSAFSGFGSNLGQAVSDGVYLGVYGASFGQIGDAREVAQLKKEYGGFATASIGLGGVSSAATIAAGGISYLGLDVALTGGAAAGNNISARGGIGPIQIGQAGENAVGIYGPKTRINVNGVFRIPDQVTDTVLREVKNVQNLSYTKQLRDYADFAQQKGLDFELYTRTSTQMSVPLNEAMNNGVIIHNYIPGM